MPEKNTVKKTQAKLHIRKGDRVKVISGKDRGLVGEVIAVYPERNRVTVAGVNIVKRHLRDTSAQPQAQANHQRAASSPRRRRSTPPTCSWSSRTPKVRRSSRGSATTGSR